MIQVQGQISNEPSRIETREDKIVALCLLAGKTTAETSTWLTSDKTYAEVLEIFSKQTERDL